MLPTFYRNSLIIVLAFLLFNCSNDEFGDIKTPENLLNEEKFTQVLAEMMLLEASVQNESSNVEHIHKVMEVSSPNILKKHHVSKKTYEESFDYYAHDKLKMEEIYTKILDDYNIKLSKLK
jgi:cell fate regulator YaaT (PSP1 superfamily)